MVDYRFEGHTRTKLPTNKLQKGVYATMLKKGRMLLGPQYGRMT
jgi:hypothetical protein